MSDRRLGIAYGVLAYALWGLFPLYWPLLEPSGALEILAHRVVWSLLVVAVLLGVGRHVRWLRELGVRRLGLLALAAVLIAVNWGTYIYGVTNERVVETSLGYFVNPLVTVMLGVVVLGERLRTLQWVALGIATAAVLGLTVEYGQPPWVAMVLAVSFALYALVKKKAGVGAVQSLTVETAVLVVPAAVFLIVLGAGGSATFGSSGTVHAVLVVATGVVTAVPLLAFAGAANRVPLTTLGLLQYLAPTIQFALGVLVYGEPMPPARLAGFVLVWTALAVFTFDALSQHRRYRQRQLRLAVEAVR